MSKKRGVVEKTSKDFLSKQFEVNEILDRRLDKEGNKEYNISWVGYNKNYNTWEPKVNLQNAMKKVSQFEEKSL